MRTIYRDEVSEQIRRHGGRLEPDFNGGDDCELYLILADGFIVGWVSPFDRHPHPMKICDDIPF